MIDSIFTADVEVKRFGDNYFVSRHGSHDIGMLDDDVSAHLEAWSRGERLFSKLAWADTLRNTRIAYELEKKEPTVVLEVGCGDAHPIGHMIAGMGLDTHYVGMDASAERAARVTTEKGRRPFVGLHANGEWGIPVKDETCDVVLCLEALEHFVNGTSGVTSFFQEVARVMPRHGVFYLATPVPHGDVLMHPHCHDYELKESQVDIAANAAGLAIWHRWCYRTRPQVAKKIRVDSGIEFMRGHGMPPAIVDAYCLPMLTYSGMGFSAGPLPPGNAMYVMGHGNDHTNTRSRP